MARIKTLKFSDCIKLTKPKYRYLKIIPHTSCKNNKADEIASYVNYMYKKLNKRMIKSEKGLIVESKCKLSYYIYITKNDASFYFIVPEYHLEMIKNKIYNSWSKKVNVVEVNEIPRFTDDSSKCQMTYKNVDGLSLAVDKRDNDLLASNLSVITSMKNDDAVGIIYNFMPSSNRDSRVWLTRYEEDYEKFRSNKNIERINLDLKQITKLAFVNFIKVADTFIKEIQTALAKENIQIEAINKISGAIDSKRSLSSASIKKKNDTIIKTQIVVMSQSKDKIQQEKLLDSLSNSFEVIKEDNQLMPKQIKHKFQYEDYNFKTDIIQCSDKELGGNAINLPGKRLLYEYKIDKNEVTESMVPEELKAGYIKLGENKYKNNKEIAYFNSKPSLINLPIAILGGSRSGKSTLSENICKNIIDAGEGLIVFDYIKNTEFADNIRRITPVDRLIDLDLTDPNCYQAFSYNELNITDNMTNLQKIKVSNKKIKQILNLVDSINDDGKRLSGKMRRYLISAGKIVFLDNDASLKDVIRCLQNHVVRNNLINKLNNEMKEALEEDIDNLLEINEYDKKEGTITGTKDSKIEGIIDRVNLLKEDPNMDLMYSLNPTNNINFVDAMNEGKVILIRLKESEYNENLSKNILVTFFITKIWLATLIRNTTECKRCTVIIDEIFQVPMAQYLVGKELVQSAKFNLRYIFTLHYLNQLSEKTKEDLKNANASYVLISGCDKRAYKELEEEFKSNDYDLSDLLNLEEYHSLNLIKTSKAYASFITKLPPPI